MRGHVTRSLTSEISMLCLDGGKEKGEIFYRNVVPRWMRFYDNYADALHTIQWAHLQIIIELWQHF